MRSLIFDKLALEDLEWWVREDKKTALRIIKLIQSLPDNPFKGIGKPVALKHDLSGCWSRRIDEEQIRRKVLAPQGKLEWTRHLNIWISAELPQL